MNIVNISVLNTSAFFLSIPMLIWVLNKKCYFFIKKMLERKLNCVWTKENLLSCENSFVMSLDYHVEIFSHLNLNLQLQDPGNINSGVAANIFVFDKIDL